MIRVDEAAARRVAARDSDYDHVADNKGRLLGIQIVGDLAEFTVPPYASCGSVEGHQVSVERGHIERSVDDGHAAVRGSAAEAHFFGQAALVMPQLRSGPCVNGENVIPGSREVQHPVSKQGSSFESVRHARLETPDGSQFADVRAIDLLQRTEPQVGVIPSVHEPVVGIAGSGEQACRVDTDRFLATVVEGWIAVLASMRRCPTRVARPAGGMRTLKGGIAVPGMPSRMTRSR